MSSFAPPFGVLECWTDVLREAPLQTEIKAFLQGINAQLSDTVDRSAINAQNGQALAEILAGRRNERNTPTKEQVGCLVGRNVLVGVFPCVHLRELPG